ncbi:hypothetical protein F511_07093 [Dorcoceras hygrometricum]|nr:hypothetical protein F511_07093 [Dorcoceras hygrometricum]
MSKMTTELDQHRTSKQTSSSVKKKMNSNQYRSDQAEERQLREEVQHIFQLTVCRAEDVQQIAKPVSRRPTDIQADQLEARAS